MLVRRLLWSGALIALSAPVTAQTSPAPPIVGTWLLESIVDTLPNGSVAYWMGRQPTGAIVYSASGDMSVQFMRDPRPVLPAATLDAQRLAGARPFAGLSAQQSADLLDGYYAYFGRYQVNPAGDSIAHYVETSMRPSEVGVTYRRQIRLEGDRLFISLHAVEDDVPRHRVLTWRRAVVAPMYREPRHHLVAETPGVRIMDVRIRPQDTTLYHHHAHTTLYVAIAVSPTVGQRLGSEWDPRPPGGRPAWTPGAFAIDSSYAAEPLTHRVTNRGRTLFRLLAISVKDNAAVAHPGELPGAPAAASSWFRVNRVALAPGEASQWQAAASPMVVVQPGEGSVEAEVAGDSRRLEHPGAFLLIDRGTRYRIRNAGASRIDALLVQTP